MSEPERLDQLQGYIRAEEHLQALAALLRPDFAFVPALRNAVPYDGPDGKPSELANVEINYVLERSNSDPDATREQLYELNSSVFTRVEELWLGEGYEVITRTVDQPHRVLRVKDPGDEFVMSLKQGTRGNLWVTSSSAPVRRTGVKPPPPVLS